MIIVLMLIPASWLQKIKQILGKKLDEQEAEEKKRQEELFRQDQEKWKKDNEGLQKEIKAGKICENCEFRPTIEEGPGAGMGLCQYCWDRDAEEVQHTENPAVPSDEEDTWGRILCE